jgi:predicted DNA-binding protein YlxM (UPF0122 family)
MENREYLTSLFDIYKDLLTSTEQETFISYYIEDLSLSEIAENRKISKSSVGKTLSQAETKLKEYESIIGKEQIKKELENLLEERDITNLKKRITKIIEK